MANMHMKRCLTSFVITKMLIKIMRYYFTMRCAHHNPHYHHHHQEITSVGMIVNNWDLVLYWLECKIVQPLLKTSGSSSAN